MGRFVGQVKPLGIHLLGMGAKSKKAPAYLDAIHEANPATQVTQDANLFQASVGRKGGIRKLTAAQDQVRDEHLEGWNREGEDDEFGASGDYTDEIAEPSAWAGRAALVRIATEAGLDDEQARAFYRDPDGLLQEPCSGGDSPAWYEHPVMAHALDTAWIAEWDRRLTASRKMEAITRAFKADPIAGQVKPRKPKNGAAA